MLKNIFKLVLLGAIVLGLFSQVALAAPRSVEVKGKVYYIVDGNDKAMDTGKEVCVAAGRTCVGYTATNLDVCLKANPGAKTVTDANGSKAGFFCDGSPQGGVCANEKNTCHICPNCNLNMDCDTQIGDLYRQAFVECSGADSDTPTIVEGPGAIAKLYDWSSNWWGKLRSSVARSFDEYRKKLGVLMRSKLVKKGTIQITDQNGKKVDVNVPEDSYVCEFYQANKKLATCGALAAADSFCVTAMNSQYAKAELCQDNGVIVCSNPCTTSPQQIKPKQCAFDNDRTRGKQAPPLDFCTETKTIKVDLNLDQKTLKRAGQECANGGECSTGICLGQPSAGPMKYFCSCSQTRHDTSCNK